MSRWSAPDHKRFPQPKPKVFAGETPEAFSRLWHRGSSGTPPRGRPERGTVASWSPTTGTSPTDAQAPTPVTRSQRSKSFSPQHDPYCVSSPSFPAAPVRNSPWVPSVPRLHDLQEYRKDLEEELQQVRDAPASPQKSRREGTGLEAQNGERDEPELAGLRERLDLEEAACAAAHEALRHQARQLGEMDLEKAELEEESRFAEAKSEDWVVSALRPVAHCCAARQSSAEEAFWTTSFGPDSSRKWARPSKRPRP